MNAPKGKPAVIKSGSSKNVVGKSPSISKANVKNSGSNPKGLVQKMAQKGKTLGVAKPC